MEVEPGLVHVLRLFCGVERIEAAQNAVHHPRIELRSVIAFP
jgi:hypothetical protein